MKAIILFVSFDRLILYQNIIENTHRFLSLYKYNITYVSVSAHTRYTYTTPDPTLLYLWRLVENESSSLRFAVGVVLGIFANDVN